MLALKLWESLKVAILDGVQIVLGTRMKKTKSRFLRRLIHGIGWRIITWSLQKYELHFDICHSICYDREMC